MSLSTDEEAAYSAIIDLILAKSDLQSVSAKAVRRELGERLGKDVSQQRDAINALIGQRFDNINSHPNGKAKEAPEHTSATNGVVKSIEEPAASASPPARGPTPKRSNLSDSSELSEPVEEPQPKKKRTKVTAEDDDAAFAARLQAEENSRARPTRGGGTRKRAPLKKEKVTAKKKKKSSTKIKAEDDSDLDSGSEEEEKERKGGFHKPMILSESLVNLLGETQLSRPQTVKKIWEYVRQRDLQDPKDRRQIRCDDAMRAVFKSDKVHMFTMNKILNQNLYAVDE